MDDRLFDRLTLVLTEHLSRRRLGHFGAGVLTALGLSGLASPHASAKARKRRKRRDDDRKARGEADKPSSRVSAEKKKKKKKKQPQPAACTPQCAGKTCGRGGCAGALDDACGPCDVRAGFTCSDLAAGGDCLCPSGNLCDNGARCCAATSVCLHTQCCAQSSVCNGAACCTGDEACLVSGCCPDTRVCDDACCGEDETCIADECCPNADACGGTACCTDEETCVDDGCCPDADVCNDDECCGPNQACLETGCCAEGRVCDDECCRADEICDDETTTCRCPDGEKPCEGACIPEDECCDNGGLLPGADLQAAVNAAPSGGTVVLGCGTFNVSQQVAIRKHLTLRGQGPEHTRIANVAAPGPATSVLMIGGDTSHPVYTVRIEDLAVSGGNKTDINGTGGISGQRTNLTVVNCLIENNSAAQGGGIGCITGVDPCSLVVINSVIRENLARVQTSGRGGGVYVGPNYQLTMTDCVVSENEALIAGGGVFTQCPATLQGCSITGNVSTGRSASAGNGGHGGGLTFGIVDGEVRLIDCEITGNEARGVASASQPVWGGGIWISGIDPDLGSSVLTLDNTRVHGNFASSRGGGIEIDQRTGPVVVNVTNNSDVSDNCPDNCNPATFCPAATVDCP